MPLTAITELTTTSGIESSCSHSATTADKEKLGISAEEERYLRDVVRVPMGGQRGSPHRLVDPKTPFLTFYSVPLRFVRCTVQNCSGGRRQMRKNYPCSRGPGAHWMCVLVVVLLVVLLVLLLPELTLTLSLKRTSGKTILMYDPPNEA